MISISITILILIQATLLLAGCMQTGLATPEPVNLTIAGSTEMMPLLVDLTSEFSNRHPTVLFSLRSGGSTLGESWVASGSVDLAASTLFYDDEAVPAGLTRVPIGIDGIAIVVHATNPITGLTSLQLRDLYSGRALDWQDVGGAPGEVLLVSREDGSGTRQLFEERILSGDSVALTAVVMPTSKDVVGYVATHPNATGYVSQAYIRPSTTGATETNQYLDRIHVLSLEGMAADIETLATQQYHLSRPLFLHRRTRDRGWPQQFIDFVLSPAGQQIVGRYHVRIR